jgi:predicted dehydrogenase
MDGVKLIGVADRRPEQARTVAEPLGVRALTDYRELLDDVDAISIAVPTSLHHEVASAFLGQGIPILVEKPLAPTLAEAEQLVSLAQARNTLLQVGHIERFNPALKALDELRMRPKYIAAERMSTYTFRSTDIGVILDLMIHDIDVVLNVVQAQPIAVSAMGLSLLGRHEDIANARIWFEGGTVADLSASRASYVSCRKMRLWGAEGYATLDFAAKQATIVRPSESLRRGELDMAGVDVSQPAAVRQHLFGKVLRVHKVEPEPADALTVELEEFVRSARTGSRPRVTGEDALRSIRLADSILQSLDTHRWEGTPDGPTGPLHLPEPVEPIAGLAGPKLWRVQPTRPEHAPKRRGSLSD